MVSMASNTIDIIIDSKDKSGPGMASARRGMDDVDKSAGGLSKGLGSLASKAKIAGAALAAVAVVSIGKAITDWGQKAVDAGETLSKAGTIFKDGFKDIDAWSNNSAKTLGLSKIAALDATASFGNMFDQLGFTQAQTKKMSTSMVELAADFGSFHNADITSVIEAQSAAFRGEYDSLQKFVPTINAANVEQKALAMTGKAATKELTAQEKAAAAMAFMMENAGEATGDMGRTIDSAANQQKVATAVMEDAQTQIGQKFVPILEKLTKIKLKLADVLADVMIPALEKMETWWKNNKEKIQEVYNVVSGGLKKAFEIIGAVITDYVVPALKKVSDAFLKVAQNEDLVKALAVAISFKLVPAFIRWAISASIAAAASLAAAASAAAAFMVAYGPIILIGLAITALAYLIIHNWDTIKKYTAKAWDWIKEKSISVWNFIKKHIVKVLAGILGPITLVAYIIYRNWDSIKNFTVEAFTAVKDFILGVWDAIKNAATAVWDTIYGIVSAVIGFIVAVISGAVEVIKAIWRSIGTEVMLTLNLIWALVSLVFTIIYTIIRLQIELIIKIVQALIPVFKAVWDGIWAAVSWAIDLIVSFIKAQIDVMIALFNLLKDPVLAVWNFIKDTAVTVWNAIYEAVSAAAGWIWDKIKWVTDKVVNAWNWVYEKVRGVWDSVYSAVSAAAGWIWDKIKWVTDKVSQAWDPIYDTIKLVFDRVKDAVGGAMDWVYKNTWGRVQDIIDKINELKNAISGVSIDSIGGGIKSTVGKLNPFASGGVSSGGLSIVGENGPELARLSPGQRIFSNPTSRAMLATGSGTGGGSIIVNVHGSILSERELSRVIKDAISNGGMQGVI